MLLRTVAKRREEGVNATALPEKQEVRRNPKADGDGFMASINYCSIDIVSVLFMEWIHVPRSGRVWRVIVKISKEEFLSAGGWVDQLEQSSKIHGNVMFFNFDVFPKPIFARMAVLIATSNSRYLMLLPSSCQGSLQITFPCISMTMFRSK